MGSARESKTDLPVVRAATPRRRFQLLDAMILVAATAIGCALCQGLDRLTGGEISLATVLATSEDYGQSLSVGEDLAECILLLGLLAMPVVLMWTMALIPIRLIRPRPQFRRMVRQPGFMAACASVVAVAFVVTPWVIVATILGWGPVGNQLSDAVWLWGGMHTPIGLSVLISWLMLLASGRWRSETSWVDRLGRVLGTYWIVAGIAFTGTHVFLSARPPPLPTYISVPRPAAAPAEVPEATPSDATNP